MLVGCIRTCINIQHTHKTTCLCKQYALLCSFLRLNTLYQLHCMPQGAPNEKTLQQRRRFARQLEEVEQLVTNIDRAQPGCLQQPPDLAAALPGVQSPVNWRQLPSTLDPGGVITSDGDKDHSKQAARVRRKQLQVMHPTLSSAPPPISRLCTMCVHVWQCHMKHTCYGCYASSSSRVVLCGSPEHPILELPQQPSDVYVTCCRSRLLRLFLHSLQQVREQPSNVRTNQSKLPVDQTTHQLLHLCLQYQQ
jgi:hypothetical protein